MSHRDVRDLLYEGERIEREVEVGRGRVVVTDRRLLAFTPDAPGKNYRHVERPNVTGVGVRNLGASSALWKAAPYLLLCGLLVAVGVAFDPGRPLSGVTTGPGASAVGMGGMIGTIDYWFSKIDEVVVVLGVLSGLPAVYYVVGYLRTRREVIAVEIAGEDDVDMPIDSIEDPDDVVGRIRQALDLPAERDEELPEWET